MTIEGKFDSREVARCARYLIGKGIMPRNNSDLLNLIVQLANYAIHDTEEFATFSDARAYLENTGIVLNRSGRGKSIMHRVLQEETLAADGFDTGYGKRRLTMKDFGDIDSLVRDAVNSLDKSSADEQGRVDEGAFIAKEQAKSEQMKAALDAIAQSKGILLKKGGDKGVD